MPNVTVPPLQTGVLPVTVGVAGGLGSLNVYVPIVFEGQPANDTT